MLDEKTQKIYLTNYKKRTEVQLWLKRNFKKSEGPLIKPLFAEKDFIEKIESINEISMTVQPNLFNASSKWSLTRILRDDALGYGADEATLTFKYKKRMSNVIRDRARDLISHRPEFKEITIVGKSLDGFDTTFNTSEIVNKITVHPAQDPRTQMFVPQEVFHALIAEIKNSDERP